ncbi:MAG: riboflavin synthase, partial [Dehalococcoidia bacterium]|nr:riboflavin synthase [Dehalococcoidia bacterium]
LGGHFVQGHVDAVGKVSSLVSERNAVLLKCSAPAQVMRYIVKKGFIAIDGVSLTVVERDISSFKVSLVTYSRANTTLGERRLADSVNLEVDILAKYVEILVKGGGTGVTTDLLTKYGFLA